MSGAETGWLIEKHGVDGRAMWWDGLGWTTVAARAIRYARKQDAAQVIRCEAKSAERFDGAAPIEHQWGPDPDPPAKSWREG